MVNRFVILTTRRLSFKQPFRIQAKGSKTTCPILHLLSLTQSGEPTFVKAAFHTPRSWAAFPDLCDQPDLPDCELGSSFWPLQACHLETIIWLCFKALTKITRIQNAVNFSSACAVRRTGGRAGPAPGNWPLGFIPKLRASLKAEGLDFPYWEHVHSFTFPAFF